MEGHKQKILSTTSIKIRYFYSYIPYDIKLFLFIKLILGKRDVNLIK